MPAAIDITGKRYGKLVALEYAGYLRTGPHPKRSFRFQCDCGAVVVKTLMDVRQADTISCGCHKRELARAWGTRSRLTEGESSFRALYAVYRARGKQLNVLFKLTVDEFRALTSGSCYYCNAAPSQRKRATASSFGTYLYNGIDRLDNDLGYVQGNVVSCCGPCNKAKREMHVSEFLDLVRRIYHWRCHAD